MTRFTALALACTFSLAACSAGELPADSAEAAESAAPTAPADTAEAATTAEQLAADCRALPDRSGCYDAALSDLARSDVRQALATLEALSRLDSTVIGDGHMYVHAVGIAAYDPDRDFGELFRSCTELFHAGCYHGLIQARFAAGGEITRETVSSMCNEVVPNPDADRWTYFQCLHGMGHGLVIHADHDLIEGLAGCDLLDDDWSRSSCQGGAFMENVSNATHPHHAALTASLDGGGHGGMDHGGMDHGDMGDGEMDHGDHGSHTSGHASHGGGQSGGHSEGHGAAAAEPFLAIDRSDPQYPCSIVREHQKAACYEMQTSVILYLNGYDFGRAAETCDEAPPQWRPTCHRSLGRDASGHSSRAIPGVLALCGANRTEYAPFCYVGAAKAAVDWSGRPEDGLALCAAVTGDENRLRCFQAVGEQIAIVTPGPERGRDLCAATAGRDQQSCLFGAGLLPEKPAYLTAQSTSL